MTTELTIGAEADDVLTLAKNPVTDQASYTQASEVAKSIKALRAKVAEAFDPVIEAAHKSHKSAIASKKIYDDKLATADKIIRAAMAGYIAEQERIKREAQEAALAEQIQREREAQEEQARMVDLGLEAPAVAEVIYQPIESVGPQVDKGGIKYRDVWSFEITDPAALPREYLMPNEIAIGAMVRNTRGSFEIPGVRIYSEKRAII
jgi:hypothetical protein